MLNFKREKHQAVVSALHLMDQAFLTSSKCYFGGGTAIVLKYGEYRDSLDIDFICADTDGYRELRYAAVSKGVSAFFREPVVALRDFKADQYGIRTFIEHNGLSIKFEIVKEARISVNGMFDASLGVSVLLPEDMFAEKLLANADRCQDVSVHYRDAFDLGMLCREFTDIPSVSLRKAQTAYGEDIEKKLRWVLDVLSKDAVRNRAANSLMMRPEDATMAWKALADAFDRSIGSSLTPR